MPNIEVKGCAFHWTQAVWRKVQQLGLQTAYTDLVNCLINSYIRRLMALPFLPHETIKEMFEKLAESATTPVLQQLVMYIRTTWIENELWSPCSWSVFMLSVRTNKDVEGWHHALHRRANGRCALPLYVLLNFLHEEACLTTSRICLVSEKKWTQVQRKKYWLVQAKIFGLWDAFNKKEKTLEQLLKAASYLNRPTIR